MERSIISRVDPAVISIFLFFLMLFAVALGNRMRKKFWSAGEDDTRGGVNSLLAALFGLWSFVLAFTFGQSGTRFENVRGMIVDEANILRNTILKTDLLPDSLRNAYRIELRKYLEERILYYENSENEVEFNKNRTELTKSANTLWAMVVAQSKKTGTNGAMDEMARSLTNLFDIGIKREALLSFGIPAPIAYMLISLALSICLIGGFTTPAIKRKEWLVIAMFALLASVVLYITIDLSRPMQGLIKPDTGQATIVKLRELF